MKNMKRLVLTAALALMAMGAFAQDIAVFPFEDMENVLTRNEAVMFYREFSNEFSNQSAGKFTVVPRQEVEKLIDFETAFQLKDYSAKAKTAEMERVLNGTQILSGLIGRLGNNIRVIVSLYTFPELRQLPGGTSLSVANTTELFNQIPKLVKDMQDRIAGPVQPIPEGLMYKIVEGKTVTITEYIGNAVTLTIPERIQGLPVTAIRWFGYDYDGRNRGGPRNDDSVTSVTIPSSVMTIEDEALTSSSSLTSFMVDNRNPVYASVDGVLFDKSIRTLIKYPIGRNQRTYVIPSTVTSIGDWAFAECKSLISITIPASVMSIGRGAFEYCRNLTSVTIPSSVTSIGNDAFGGCDSLTSITIPSSVTSIGDCAFGGCDSLTSITIPSSVTSIGEYMFLSCQSLTSVTIPSSVTTIGRSAFNGCSSLTSITIPSSVTFVGEFAFSDCNSLTSITVDNRNPVYASIDGVLFDKNIRTLIRYPQDRKQETYVIPASVTSIGGWAFGYCRNLTSVTIPASVTSISEAMFSDCFRLTNITIPSSVTSIGDYAFLRCYSLTSVIIPSSVTSIGKAAFYDCSNLTSVTLSRRTQVGRDAFPSGARITYID